MRKVSYTGQHQNCFVRFETLISCQKFLLKKVTTFFSNVCERVQIFYLFMLFITLHIWFCCEYTRIFRYGEFFCEFINGEQYANQVSYKNSIIFTELLQGSSKEI